MRKIALTVAALATLGLTAAGCSSSYDRDATIDNFMEIPQPSGDMVTRDQAECMADSVEEAVGVDRLNEVVELDPQDYPEDVTDATDEAYFVCVAASSE